MESPEKEVSVNNESGRVTPISKKKTIRSWSRPMSPLMCGFVETDEVGWDDSPEPLKIDWNSIAPRKLKTDTAESPVSRKKRCYRDKRPKVIFPDEDLETIKRFSCSIFGEKALEPGFSNLVSMQCLPTVVPSHVSAFKVSTSPLPKSDKKPDSSNNNESIATLQNEENLPSADAAIVNFFTDDDDVWLSQVDVEKCSAPNPGKANFVKSHSDNQLESPNRLRAFRRCNSFHTDDSQSLLPKLNLTVSCSPSSTSCTSSNSDGGPQPMKKQKSFHIESSNVLSISGSQPKYTPEQIEQKRLQAIHRRESKEIERRRQDALSRRARLASHNQTN